MRIVFESSYFLECPVYIYQNTKCMEHANCRGLKYLPSMKAERLVFVVLVIPGPVFTLGQSQPVQMQCS